MPTGGGEGARGIMCASVCVCVCPLLVPVCVCVMGSEEEEEDEEEMGVVGRGSVRVCVCGFVLEEEGMEVGAVWVGMTIFVGVFGRTRGVVSLFGLIALC